MKLMSIYNAFGFSISGIGANLDFSQSGFLMCVIVVR